MCKKTKSLILFLVVYLVAAIPCFPAYADNTVPVAEPEVIRVVRIQDVDEIGYKYVDENGEDLISAVFDEVEAFYNGRALVLQDGEYKLIDREGNTVLTFDPEYGKISRISGEDVFLAMIDEAESITDWPPFGIMERRDERVYGFVNPDGTLKTPIVYRGWGYVSSLDKVNGAYKRGEGYGLVSSDGTELTEFIYDGFYSAGDGMVMLKLDDKYALLNAEAQFITDFVYENVIGFSGGIGVGKFSDRTSIFDANGNVLVEEFKEKDSIRQGNGYGGTTYYVGSVPMRNYLENIGVMAQQVNVYIDGIKQDLEIRSALHDQSTMVPVRLLAGLIGYQVGWDQASKVVTLSDDRLVVSFGVNNSTAFIAYQGGLREEKAASKRIVMEAPAVILDGQTFVPLSFLEEVFDLNVNWGDRSIYLLLDS